MYMSYTVFVSLWILLNNITEAVPPSAKVEPTPAVSLTHTPSLFSREFVSVDDSGSISMKECVERDGHSELCQCGWLIHIEDDNLVYADIYIDIPDQHQKSECHICYLAYGYLNADDQHVLIERLCGENETAQYDSSSSLWLRFVCVGPSAHHKLNWTKEDGTDRLGFTVTYTVTKKQIAVKNKWDLSSSFALIVALMTAFVLVALGVILRRSCRGQSIQRALWEIKQESTKQSDPRLTRIRNSNTSRHKPGLHEMLYTRRQRSDHGRVLSTVQQRHEYDNQDFNFCRSMNGTDINRIDIDVEGTDKPTVQPRPSHTLPVAAECRSPTRSNHTYISITHTDDVAEAHRLTHTASLNCLQEVVDQQQSDCTITLQQRQTRARSLDIAGSGCSADSKRQSNSQLSTDAAARNFGSTSSIINTTSELKIDDLRQKKLLVAPRYTSPQIGPVPHIILTRPSIRSHHQLVDEKTDGCTHQHVTTSTSTSSLPGHMTKDKLQQTTNYNSADCMATANSRFPSMDNLKIKPRTLHKGFTDGQLPNNS